MWLWRCQKWWNTRPENVITFESSQWVCDSLPVTLWCLCSCTCPWPRPHHTLSSHILSRVTEESVMFGILLFSPSCCFFPLLPGAMCRSGQTTELHEIKCGTIPKFSRIFLTGPSLNYLQQWIKDYQCWFREMFLHCYSFHHHFQQHHHKVMLMTSQKRHHDIILPAKQWHHHIITGMSSFHYIIITSQWHQNLKYLKLIVLQS